MTGKDRAPLVAELQFPSKKGLSLSAANTMLTQERLARMYAQKAAVGVIDGGFSVNRILLRHSQGFQRRLINGRGGI